jgi:hypothetical protein
MATKGEIEQAILTVAGNPVSGVIRDMVGAFADAIVALDEDPADTPKRVNPIQGTAQQREKETRVLGAVEQR